MDGWVDAAGVGRKKPERMVGSFLGWAGITSLAELARLHFSGVLSVLILHSVLSEWTGQDLGWLGAQLYPDISTRPCTHSCGLSVPTLSCLDTTAITMILDCC